MDDRVSTISWSSSQPLRACAVLRQFGHPEPSQPLHNEYSTRPQVYLIDFKVAIKFPVFDKLSYLGISHDCAKCTNVQKFRPRSTTRPVGVWAKSLTMFNPTARSLLASSLRANPKARNPFNCQPSRTVVTVKDIKVLFISPSRPSLWSQILVGQVAYSCRYCNRPRSQRAS